MLAVTTISKRQAESNLDELERLKRDYLPMWAKMAGGGAAVSKGLPSEVPYTDYMKGSGREFDHSGEDAPDPWSVNVVEAAIMEISPRIPLARAALNMRYVWGSKQASVYRHGRLTALSMDELHSLCDATELALVPVVKRRGLPL